MACKDKRKVWVDVKRHERRVLKCQNKPKKRTKAIPNKLKVKLPGIEKKRAIPPRQATPLRSPPRRRIHMSPPRATPPRFSATPPPKRISPHRKTPRKGVALERLTFRKPHKKRVKPTYDDAPLNDIRRIREFKVRPARTST